jgi:hypothetical protein
MAQERGETIIEIRDAVAAAQEAFRNGRGGLADLRQANQKVYDGYSAGGLSSTDVDSIRNGKSNPGWGNPQRGGT